jgi:hypothetical protein
MSIERYTSIIAGRAVIAVTVVVPKCVIPATSMMTVLKSSRAKGAPKRSPAMALPRCHRPRPHLTTEIDVADIEDVTISQALAR